MAKLELEQQWTIRVTSKEFMLIRAALGGRLEEKYDAEATRLDNDLARQLVDQTRDRLAAVDKLAKNLKDD